MCKGRNKIKVVKTKFDLTRAKHGFFDYNKQTPETFIPYAFARLTIVEG